MVFACTLLLSCSIQKVLAGGRPKPGQGTIASLGCIPVLHETATAPSVQEEQTTSLPHKVREEFSDGGCGVQGVPAEVLQEQLEQLQHQHDQLRAEAQQSMQAKEDLVQQLQQQNWQLASGQASQVRQHRQLSTSLSQQVALNLGMFGLSCECTFWGLGCWTEEQQICWFSSRFVWHKSTLAMSLSSVTRC